MSKTFMFLNLAGHAISFYLDATGRKDLQRMANKCRATEGLMFEFGDFPKLITKQLEGFSKYEHNLELQVSC